MDLNIVMHVKGEIGRLGFVIGSLFVFAVEPFLRIVLLSGGRPTKFRTSGLF